MDANGDQGWAVGGAGVLLRYDGSRWNWDQSASAASGGKYLNSVWMDDKGERGWAVGELGVMLHYDRAQWKRDELASAASNRNLSSVWIDRKGERGWAVGDAGIVLRYDGKQWKRDESAISTSGGEYLIALWMDANGERGWAAGKDGLVLQYDGARWTRNQKAGPASDPRDLNGVWMEAEGERGWAVGKAGVVLRYDSTQWKRDDAASAASGGKYLNSMWMNPKGEQGWAVGGHGVVLRFDGTQWKREESASAASGGKDLNAIWMDAKGEQGWAIGEYGVMLRCDRMQWKRDESASPATDGRTLNAVWVDAKGERGWAVGNHGMALRYDGKQWKQDESASGASVGKNLRALWMDAKGEQGWAVGEYGVVLRYDATEWKQDELASLASGRKGLNAIWMDANERGWAVGEYGVILRYDGMRWKQDESASAASGGKGLCAIWMDANERGWAVGESGVILRYDGMQWKRDESASQATDGKAIRGVWVDAKDKRGWAVGEYGVVLRYDGTLWKRDESASAVSGPRPLYAVWTDARGERGWAVGRDRVVVRYDGTQWKRDESANLATYGKSLNAVQMDANGQRGWAVGSNGVILSFMPEQVKGLEIESEVEQLSGSVGIRFRGVAPHPGSVKIEVMDADGAGLFSSRDANYLTIEAREGNAEEFIAKFTSKSAKIAERNAGQRFQLQVSADFGSPIAPVRMVFKPIRTTFFKGSYWLLPYIYVIASIAVLNLVLVAAAVYSPWVRRVALDPTIRAVVGVGVLKYLITEPLLIYVPQIRKALFRGYRASLAAHPQLSKWDSVSYVFPLVSSPTLKNGSDNAVSPEKMDGQQTVSGAQTEGNPIGALVEALLMKQNSRRQLWLIKGPSGLGKSAFLQQIAREALRQGQTPLLLPLGSDRAPEQEVADLMSEYGEMKVTAATAMDIVDGGGFMILLDALNEDRQPQATLDFVRKARKRNVVLLTSQFAPSWPQSVPIERLNLAPFGREQLMRVIPPDWVESVISAPHLSKVVGLPITAVLLGRYIETNQHLPASDIAIYSHLSERLEKIGVTNLESKAWELFKSNGQQFKTDERLTVEFCEDAVTKRTLTRRAGSSANEVFYRFLHERVHRYFVACYVARQDPLSLPEWHSKLDPGFGKGYWADVLDFLGAMHALSEETIGIRTTRYTKFLHEAAEFAPKIFAERLYSQYQRYRDAGAVERMQQFEDWAASFLANIVSGKE